METKAIRNLQSKSIRNIFSILNKFEQIWKSYLKGSFPVDIPNNLSSKNINLRLGVNYQTGHICSFAFECETTPFGERDFLIIMNKDDFDEQFIEELFCEVFVNNMCKYALETNISIIVSEINWKKLINAYIRYLLPNERRIQFHNLQILELDCCLQVLVFEKDQRLQAQPLQVIREWNRLNLMVPDLNILPALLERNPFEWRDKLFLLKEEVNTDDVIEAASYILGTRTNLKLIKNYFETMPEGKLAIEANRNFHEKSKSRVRSYSL